jgi:hypothetical protein
VTSPVARRVLEQLFNMADCQTDRSEISSYGRDFSPQDVDYTYQLRRRLRESTLAAQLAAGPCAIPDISEAVSGLPAVLLRLGQPRTLEQYVKYLVVNLDWVLEPASIPDWRSQVHWGCLEAFASTLGLGRYAHDRWRLVAVIAVLLLWVGFLTICYFCIGWLLLFIALSLVLYGLSAAPRIAGRGCSLPVQRLIHTTELYWYLRQALSDSGFPDDQLPDPGVPHP